MVLVRVHVRGHPTLVSSEKMALKDESKTYVTIMRVKKDISLRRDQKERKRGRGRGAETRQAELYGN